MNILLDLISQMKDIECGQYSNPEQVGGYTGWINPHRKSGQDVPAWMLFIKTDGTVKFGVRNDKDMIDFLPH